MCDFSAGRGRCRRLDSIHALNSIHERPRPSALAANPFAKKRREERENRPTSAVTRRRCLLRNERQTLSKNLTQERSSIMRKSARHTTLEGFSDGISSPTNKRRTFHSFRPDSVARPAFSRGPVVGCARINHRVEKRVLKKRDGCCSRLSDERRNQVIRASYAQRTAECSDAYGRNRRIAELSPVDDPWNKSLSACHLGLSRSLAHGTAGVSLIRQWDIAMK